MKDLMKKIRKKAGFTLAELLIVVAIIAVLVAIAIPIFTTQLEKSRESADAANLRAAYAVGMTKILDSDVTDVNVGPVKLQQTGTFDKISADTKIGDLTLNGLSVTGDAYVHVSESGHVTIDGTPGDNPIPATGYES